MAHRSGAKRAIGAVADATGRTDEELVLGLTVVVVAAGVITALRLLKFLGDHDLYVVGHSRKSV